MSYPIVQAANKTPIILPSKKERKDKKEELIKKIALAALKELAVCLIYASVAILFVSSAHVPMFFLTGVIVALFNTAVRASLASLDFELFCLGNDNSDAAKQRRKDIQKAKKIGEWAAPLIFAGYDFCTRDTVVHEGGHFLAAHAVYTNPKASIHINSFGLGGETEYHPGKLTSFGTWLGRQNSEIFVAAAGVGLTTIVGSVNIVLAHKLKKTNPELSRYLIVLAVVSIAMSVLYALTAFTATENINDFYFLWKTGGIHPITSAISIIALPILVKAGLLLYDRMKARAAKNSNIPPIKTVTRIPQHSILVT